MTVAECSTALDALTDEQFTAFRQRFGGSYTTRQEYVDHFVHHPEHERLLCQLLRVDSEQDKLTAATVSSARAAAASASSARRAMIGAGLTLLVAITAVYQSSRWAKSP